MKGLNQNRAKFAGLVSRAAVSLGVTCVLSLPALAQLVPDDTLGAGGSQIVRDTVVPGGRGDRITGGITRGSNLFHSFEVFNVRAGQQVYFDSPGAIANIFSRVTGGNLSTIRGTLGVDGSANLYLLNPNGILFGPDARLDIAGSFVVTTGDRLLFPGGQAFSAVNPQAPSLLMVNVPIGLQYGANPGPIRAQGSVLQVGFGQELTLAGGAIQLVGVNLSAPVGEISLIGIGGAGTVERDRAGQLTVPDPVPRATIRLFRSTVNNAVPTGTVEDSGNIDIIADSLLLNGGTQLSASTFGDGDAGDITIDVQETLELRGSRIFNSVEPGARGQGGLLQISANRFRMLEGSLISASTRGDGDAGDLSLNIRGDLQIWDGAQLDASTFGNGDAGIITIDVQGTLDMRRASPSAVSGGNIFNSVGLDARGQGGLLQISANTLRLLDGSVISSSTSGRGNAGDITVNVEETLEARGTSPNGTSSSIVNTVQPGAVGQGGILEISANHLRLSGGARLDASTSGIGSAGDITVNVQETLEARGTSPDQTLSSGIFNTVEPGAVGQGGILQISANNLRLSGGAQLDASTFGRGNAGDTTIQVREDIELRGTSPDGTLSGIFNNVESGAVGQGGIIFVSANNLRVLDEAIITSSTGGEGIAGDIFLRIRDQLELDQQAFIAALAEGQPGNTIPRAGSLTIQSDRLSLAGGSEITVSALTGQAGSLEITAREIRLENSGIEAETGFSPDNGQGANIQIQDLDRLLMRHDSVISARALGDADGGNVTIDAANGVIVAPPFENNDIIATAERGDGGDIDIRVLRLFEFSDLNAQRLTFEQLRTNETSDISASSEFGTQGVITYDVLTFDPSQGLTELSDVPADATQQIAPGCGLGNNPDGSEFIVTGRGGLPPSSGDPIAANGVEVPWVVDDAAPPVAAEAGPGATAIESRLIEAQGIGVDAEGTIHLMAMAPPQYRSPATTCINLLSSHLAPEGAGQRRDAPLQAANLER